MCSSILDRTNVSNLEHLLTALELIHTLGRHCHGRPDDEPKVSICPAAIPEVRLALITLDVLH